MAKLILVEEWNTINQESSAKLSALKVKTLADLKVEATALVVDEFGPCPLAVDDSKYEDRVENRRNRLEAAASRASKESDRHYERAHQLVSGIPMGQPILVGHHSERSDRNRRKKSWDAMGRSVEATKKAQHFADKAESVGSGGISSDSANAIRQLWLKLEDMVHNQLSMKAANKIVKSKKILQPEKINMLVSMGYSRSLAVEIITPDYCSRIGFPGFELSNNNANIKRVKQRINELQQLCQWKDKTYSIANGLALVEHSTEDNRIFIRNESKPEPEIRNIYKANGFRWSRYQSAWSRKLNRNGVGAVQLVATQLLALDR